MKELTIRLEQQTKANCKMTKKTKNKTRPFLEAGAAAEVQTDQWVSL